MNLGGRDDPLDQWLGLELRRARTAFEEVRATEDAAIVEKVGKKTGVLVKRFSRWPIGWQRPSRQRHWREPSNLIRRSMQRVGRGRGLRTSSKRCRITPSPCLTMSRMGLRGWMLSPVE